MERRSLIFINTDNAPMFCRSQCKNSDCTKHITKAFEYKGSCKMSLLKGTDACEGFISARIKKAEGGEKP